MGHNNIREPSKMTKTQLRGATWIATFLLLTSGSTALAQDDSNASADDGVPMDEIIVSGYRDSLVQALRTKRESEQVMEALSAEDIGKLPDNNISEALQRLTGINVGFTPGGEGGTAFIRGIQTAPGASPVRVELNGNSTGSGGRDAAISSLPASLVSGIKVFKSPAADHVEGGLAGTIRLITRNPTRLKGFTASATVRETYYDYGKDYAPFASAFVGNSWETDSGKRLGFLLSGSYTDYSLRHERIGSGFNVGVRWRAHHNHGLDIDGDGDAGESVGSAAAPVADDAIMFPGNLYNDSETRDIERGFLSAAFGFEPSAELNFKIEATYRFDTNERDRDELRLLSTHNRRINAADFEFTQHDGVTMYDADSDSFVAVPSFVRGTLNNIATRSASRWDSTDGESLNLAGTIEWTRGPWDVDFSLAFLDGETNFLSNNAQFESATATGGGFTPDVYFDFAPGGGLPSVQFADFDPTDPDAWRLRQIGRDARDDESDLSVANIDVEYDLGSDFFRSIKFGYRFADQTLERERRNKNVTAGLPGRNDPITSFENLYGLAYGSGERHLRELGGDIPRNWITPTIPVGVPTDWIADFGSGANVNSQQFADPPLNLGGSYEINEEVHAGYIMTRFGRRGDFVTGNAGVRVVSTKTTSDGFQTQPSGELAAFTVENTYTEVLPSINLSLNFTPELKLRAAAFQTMVRPGLGQLRSNQALSFNGDGELSGGTTGNPNLEAQTADGADVSLEWYFTNGALLSAGVFYREINGQIKNELTPYIDPETGEVVLEPIDPGDPTAPRDPIEVSSPINLDGVHKMSGFEAAYQHHFDFLPGWWSGFGTTMNYTYVDSKIDDDPDTPYTDFFTNITPHNFNVALYYDGERFQSRLAVSWRGETVKGFFPLRAPEYQKIYSNALNRWDFSMAYDMTEQLQVNFLWKNINDFRRQLWLGVPEQFGLNTDDESQISLGLRYNF